MRKVTRYEKTKRGCECCIDAERKRRGKGYGFFCPHDTCPHHALDKYDTYEEFMASKDAKILVNGFFYTSPSCYDLKNSNASVRKVYSKSENSMFP